MTRSALRKVPARADKTPPVLESVLAGKAPSGKPEGADAPAIAADDLERVVAESKETLAETPKKTGRPLGRRDSQPRRRQGEGAIDGQKRETPPASSSSTGGELVVDDQAVKFVAGGVRKVGDVLAVRRGCDAWKRTPEQALEIAQPAAYLMAYFFPQMDPKTAAVLSLLMAVGGWVTEGLAAEEKMKPLPVQTATAPLENGARAAPPVSAR